MLKTPKVLKYVSYKTVDIVVKQGFYDYGPCHSIIAK